MNIWERLRAEIHRGQQVNAWSAANGETGRRFQVDDFEADCLWISGAGISGRRRIRRSDLERVYAVWDDYLSGRRKRADLKPLTFNSTYVLSLLRLILEDVSKSRST